MIQAYGNSFTNDRLFLTDMIQAYGRSFTNDRLFLTDIIQAYGSSFTKGHVSGGGSHVTLCQDN
jgi:hypothetical protein